MDGLLARAARLLPVPALMMLACAPGHADDSLFRAMARLVGAGPASEPLQGEMAHGSLVDIWISGDAAHAGILSPGPGPCIVRQLNITQDKGEWAQTSTVIFDFGRIKGARFLADADDFATAVSRREDDPEVSMMSLDGKGFSCQQVVHIDPAKPAFNQVCDDNWTIVVLNEADKAAVSTAVGVVGPACFGK